MVKGRYYYDVTIYILRHAPYLTLLASLPSFPSLLVLSSPDTLTDKFTDAAYLAGPSSMHKLPRDWRRVPDRRPGKVRVLRYIRHDANSYLTLHALLRARRTPSHIINDVLQLRMNMRLGMDEYKMCIYMCGIWLESSHIYSNSPLPLTLTFCSCRPTLSGL